MSAVLAFFQVALAALGTYLIARRLSLGRAGAALAAVGFSSSSLVLGAVALPASRVTFLLPWLLYGLEGLRGARPVRALLGTAALACWVGLAAEPQVSGFMGAAGFLWAVSVLERDRRAGRLGLLALGCGLLLSAPSWLPYFEYLSQARHVARGEPREVPDLLSLGALLLSAYLLPILAVRAAGRRAATAASALVVCGLVLLLQRRGWQLVGGSSSLPGGLGWLAPPVLLLALSGLLQATGSFADRGRLVAGAVASFLVATAAPGVRDLVRLLPLGGGIDLAAAGVVAALFVSLLAGASLGRAAPHARKAAVLATLFLAGGGLGSLLTASAAPEPPVDPGDEVISYTTSPPSTWRGGAAQLTGTLHGDLALDRLSLYFEELDAGGAVVGASRFAGVAELGGSHQDGDRSFSFEELELDGLSPGTWRARLEFRRGARLLGTRSPFTIRVEGAAFPVWLNLALVLITLALLLYGSPRGETRQGASFLRAGWAPVLALLWAAAMYGAHPSGAAEDPVRLPLTEAFLRSEPEGVRVIAPEDVLPGATCLSTGVARVNADDGVGLALFERALPALVPRGAQSRAAWSAGDVDLSSEAFRSLGVELLLRHEPLEDDDWELVAGPGGAVSETEVYIYRARHPMPRAFCASSTSSPAGDVFEQRRSLPRSTALLGGGLEIELERPFEHAAVTPLGGGDDSPRYRVELDGEGILVLADQYLPSWSVHVDGEPRQLLELRGVFRGVHLSAGEHLVQLQYRPWGPRWGTRLALLGLALLTVAAAILGRLALPGLAPRR